MGATGTQSIHNLMLWMLSGKYILIFAWCSSRDKCMTFVCCATVWKQCKVVVLVQVLALWWRCWVQWGPKHWGNMSQFLSQSWRGLDSQTQKSPSKLHFVLII